MKDFGRSARKGSLSSFTKTRQILRERLLVTLGPLEDFQRSEAVNVHPGNSFMYGSGDVDVVITVEVRMDATLETNLGRSGFGCLNHTLRYVIKRE